MEEKEYTLHQINFPFGNFGDMPFLKASILYLFQNIYRELDGEK